MPINKYIYIYIYRERERERERERFAHTQYVYIYIYILFDERRQPLPEKTTNIASEIKIKNNHMSVKLLNTSDLPRSTPLVKVAFPASLSAQSFPFIPAFPRQYIHRSY